MKKFTGFASLVLALALTLSLFTSAFAATPKRIAVQPSSVQTMGLDGDITGTITDYIQLAKRLSVVKKLLAKIEQSGKIDPADAQVIAELIAKITGSLGK